MLSVMGGLASAAAWLWGPGVAEGWTRVWLELEQDGGGPGGRVLIDLQPIFFREPCLPLAGYP